MAARVASLASPQLFPAQLREAQALRTRQVVPGSSLEGRSKHTGAG